MAYRDYLERMRLEDAVHDKYVVLKGIRMMGGIDFSEAVEKWWRHYDVVNQRHRHFKGIDVVAYNAATDYIDRYMSRK